MMLAIEEINAKGGILGRKIDTPITRHPERCRHFARAGPEGARQRALRVARPGVLRVGEGRHAADPQAASRRSSAAKRGDHPEGRSLRLPHLVRPAIRCRRSPNTSTTSSRPRSVAIVWVNNDFGKGGRDVIAKELAALRHQGRGRSCRPKPARPISPPTSVKIKAAAPTRFSSTSTRKKARASCKELKRQGVTAPLIGETTLVGQKVVELAGDAANGARGHVGLTTDAPIDLSRRSAKSSSRSSITFPTTTASRAILAIYMIKATTEKMGKVDGKAFAETAARPHHQGRG